MNLPPVLRICCMGEAAAMKSFRCASKEAKDAMAIVSDIELDETDDEGE